VQKYNGRISFRSYRHDHRSTTCFQVLLPINTAWNIGSGSSGLAGRAERESAQDNQVATPMLTEPQGAECR
jgi:hypothetical protein